MRTPPLALVIALCTGLAAFAEDLDLPLHGSPGGRGDRSAG